MLHHRGALAVAEGNVCLGLQEEVEERALKLHHDLGLHGHKDPAAGVDVVGRRPQHMVYLTPNSAACRNEHGGALLAEYLRNQSRLLARGERPGDLVRGGGLLVGSVERLVSAEELERQPAVPEVAGEPLGEKGLQVLHLLVVGEDLAQVAVAIPHELRLGERRRLGDVLRGDESVHRELCGPEHGLDGHLLALVRLVARRALGKVMAPICPGLGPGNCRGRPRALSGGGGRGARLAQALCPAQARVRGLQAQREALGRLAQAGRGHGR
mmetsp:Transcript_26490/g.84272  ORF Transcript_26490/g.84272 Transcript_26490/m.84272 type:complete len:269 (-) Transcript_26490:41-847(-)